MSAVTITHWEDDAPMPPGVHNPFSEVKISLGPDGVSFTAQMDDTYEHSGAGFQRALKAWAEYEIERNHWLNLKMMRLHHASMSFYPAWPADREGVRTSQGETEI